MPDFNFTSDDPNESQPNENRESRQLNAGDSYSRQRSESGDSNRKEFPIELEQPPERKNQLSAALPLQPLPPPSSSFNAKEILPSHESQEVPISGDTTPKILPSETTIDQLSETNNFSGSPEDSEKSLIELSGAASSYHHRLAMAAFLMIVFFLVTVSFIWFYDPYPPLKQSITHFFGIKSALEKKIDATSATSVSSPVDSTQTPSIELNDMYYFVQISSWKELRKAQADGNALKKLGRHVTIEGEYIPMRRTTFYRVRLGPFPSMYEASIMMDSLHREGRTEAFVDSARRKQQEIRQTEPALLAPEIEESPRENTEQIVDEPSSGYAVKVSSYRVSDAARNEAALLLDKGFPAIVVRKQLSSGIWYRVLVGPFHTRKEADRYTKLLNVTSGNDSYTITLGIEDTQP